MPSQPSKSLLLRKTLTDICLGYSKGAFKGRSFFIKHTTNSDQLYFDEFYENALEEAISDGLLTDEQALQDVMQQGLWTKKEDLAIEKSKSYIESLRKTKDATQILSVKDKLNDTIRQEEVKIITLEQKKQKHIGMTAEKYANQLLNDEFVFKNSYLDAALTIPFFSRDHFDYLQESDLDEFITSYNNSLMVCGENNIKLLCIQDSFYNIYSICEGPVDYFGKPIKDFTFYQIKLASWGKYFVSLFANHDLSKIPAKYKEDPDKLLDFVKASEQSKKQMEKMSKHDMVFAGANNSDDMEAMGLKVNPDREFKEGLTINDFIKKYNK
jgi:hypothetical protein